MRLGCLSIRAPTRRGPPPPRKAAPSSSPAGGAVLAEHAGHLLRVGLGEFERRSPRRSAVIGEDQREPALGRSGGERGRRRDGLGLARLAATSNSTLLDARESEEKDKKQKPPHRTPHSTPL